MNLIKAKTLVINFLERMKILKDGSRLPEIVTKKEPESLVIAPSLLDESFPPTQSDADKLSGQQVQSEDVSLELNLVSLELPVAPPNMRLCFDFGTAMSKVTLITDEDDEALDDIVVLRLGIPGDQLQISKNMLVSSVYINDDGLLWFGQKAVEMSERDNKDRPRQRLDSIKRFLSNNNLDAEISPQYNPTEVGVTYHDIILAYLMFLTWAVGVCIKEENKKNKEKGGKERYPKNIKRRFAMPCFDGDEGDVSRKVEGMLRKLLGEAQVLADTFYAMFDNHQGIPLALYLEKVNELRCEHRDYNFVAESIMEPTGVANTFWTSNQGAQRSIAMVIDIGAGTTDMGLFIFWHGENENINKAAQIEGSSRTSTEAGDCLDKILMEFILSKANVGPEHTQYEFICSGVSLEIRKYKENLFKTGHVNFSIPEYDLYVSIDLDDFLNTESIMAFSNCLESTMRSILENIDESIITGTGWRGLTVILTGGGANLPMTKRLASGTFTVRGREVQLTSAVQFPAWLKKDYQELRQDYPRIAVSLGGARKDLIQIRDAITVTGIGA